MASELSRLIDDELEKVERGTPARNEGRQELRTSLRIKARILSSKSLFLTLLVWNICAEVPAYELRTVGRQCACRPPTPKLYSWHVRLDVLAPGVDYPSAVESAS